MFHSTSFKQLSLLFLLLHLSLFSQVPGNLIDAGFDVSVDCSNSCTVLSASYLETGYTTSYNVDSIYYYPFSFQGENIALINYDDTWSEIIYLPFDFCFFGETYESVLINSNGALTFSVAGEISDGKYSPHTPAGWPLNGDIPGNNGTYNGGASDPRAVLGIFGVLQDTNPQISSPDWSINYDVYGSYPNRAMVFSWYKLGHYSCGVDIGPQTYQIVLYETSGVIDVFIKDRQSCEMWWNGQGVTGIQNADGTQGYTPPNRNTGNWSAHHEAWRYTPNGTSNVEMVWKDESGTIIGTDATIDVCVEETTTFTAQAIYTTCTGETVTAEDQVTVTPLSEYWIDLGEDITSCDGNDIVLDANPDGIEGLTFQWFKSGNLISGATNSTYTVTPPNEDYYSVEVNEDGCIASGSIYIEINTPPIINEEPEPLVVCDIDNNGFALFTLHSADADITMGNGSLTVTFHINEMDAIVNENALIDPYMNVVPYHDVVYARAQETNGCFSTVPLDLIVQELPPISQPTDLVEEDINGDGFAIFDLTENTAIVLNGLNPSEYMVSYFETETDAQSDANPITDPMGYQNIENPQTVYVRVESLVTGCFEMASFVISTEYLSVNNFGFGNLSLYPNPTSESFTIQANRLKSKTTISLYDILGKVLLSKNILPQNGRISIDVSSFQNGVYFVKISSEGNSVVKKLMKE